MFSIDITPIFPFFVHKGTSFSFMKLWWIGWQEIPPLILKHILFIENFPQLLPIGIILLVHINATKSVFLAAAVAIREKHVHGIGNTVVGYDMCFLLDRNAVVFTIVVTFTIVTTSWKIRR